MIVKKINIIQFLPYFPPHKWWVENVAEEFSAFYVSKGYWDVTNVIFDIGQEEIITRLSSSDLILGSDKSNPIWYRQKWYTVYLLPAFDLIPNFPVPKFWKKEFWEILRLSELKKWIIQTHTRFFLSSLLWWVFAKYYKLKWIHVEHWSDYVKLWSKLKSKVAYIYDKMIWKWIFKKADRLVWVSKWVSMFIKNEFNINKSIEIIYNWIKFTTWNRLDNWDIIKIWFAWRIVNLKWVNLLIQAFENLSKNHANIELEIVWDWDEKNMLEQYVNKNNLKNIKFLWLKDREYIANTFLPQIDILVNPSYQEWLPTSVLEWLISSCVVVATDVGWTKEISNEEDLIIVEKWNVLELEKWLEKAILNYKRLRWKSSDIVKEKFNWDKVIDKYFNLYGKS